MEGTPSTVNPSLDCLPTLIHTRPFPFSNPKHPRTHPYTHTHSFDLHPHLSASERARGVTEMRLVFPASTDFYGRVTMYQLKVLGREAGK